MRVIWNDWQNVPLWGIASNGSGDYVVAFSTDSLSRIPHQAPTILNQRVLSNEAATPLFLAAIEATEEAIINALFAAKTMKGMNKLTIEALPIDKVLEIMKKYNRVKE
jgi:D-aminopeptidase